MRSLTKIFILILFISSCTSNKEEQFNLKNSCNVEDPVADLGWLKADIDNFTENPTEYTKYLYIMQSKYKGETVFVFANCCPQCNTAVTVFNCEGEQIGNIGDGTIGQNDITESEIIWKPSDSVCFTAN